MAPTLQWIEREEGLDGVRFEDGVGMVEIRYRPMHYRDGWWWTAKVGLGSHGEWTGWNGPFLSPDAARLDLESRSDNVWNV